MSDLDRDQLKTMEHLLVAIEKVYQSPKQIAARSFLAGIFTGLGATVGVTIVLAVLTFILSKLQLLPVFGDLIKEMRINQVLK